MSVPKGKHIDIIEAFAKGFELEGKNDAYLELGVAGGRCFRRVAQYFKESVGVEVDEDIVSQNMVDLNLKKGSLVFLGTTDEFFSEEVEKPKFNLIFIDADHSYESVQRDFNNSVTCLEEGGLIVLHDTYPQSVAWTKACKDAYKIRYVLNSTDGYHFVTLPFCSGLTVVSLNK